MWGFVEEWVEREVGLGLGLLEREVRLGLLYNL